MKVEEKINRDYLAGALALMFCFLLWSCGDSGNHSGRNLESELITIEDSLNYVLGMGTTKFFSYFNESDYNAEIIKQGALDVINKDTLLITLDQKVQEMSRRYFTEVQNFKSDSLYRQSSAFLEQNSKKEGVIVSPRGLQYKYLKKGSAENPSPNGYDIVFIDYKQGTPFKGLIWDKSKRTNPTDTISIAINRELTGLSELCQYMKTGDRVQAWLPPEIGSAAGTDLVGISEKNEVIFIEVELYKIDPRPREEVSEGERNGYNSYFKDESYR